MAHVPGQQQATTCLSCLSNMSRCILQGGILLMSAHRTYILSGSWYSNSSQHNKQQQRLQQHCYSSKTIYFRGKGQKRELPVVSWPESGGQKYEGSKHSIWAHVIGQHYLPPISGRTPTGTSPFSLLWSAPTRLWPHFVAFRCSSPVHSIWPAWRRTTTQIPRPDAVSYTHLTLPTKA